MKVFSPQLGFNNNVRHKGRVFHIQTEDSGVKHPHIITHLFADGGRILKSTKTSYADFVGDEELPKKVRSLMQEQHKAMFIALRGGKFDHMMGDVPEAPGPKPDEAAQRQSSLAVAADFVQTPTQEPPPKSGEGSVSARAPTELAVPAAAPSAPSPATSSPAPSARAPSPAASTPGAASPPAPPVDSEARARVGTAPAAPVALAAARAAPAAPPSQPDTDALSPRTRLTRPPARQTLPPPPAEEPAASRPKTSPPPPGSGPGTAFRSMLGRASSPDLFARTGPQRTLPSAFGKADPLAETAQMRAHTRPSTPPPAVRPASIPPARPRSPGGLFEPPTERRRPAAREALPLATGLDLDLQALELAAEQTNAPVYQQVRDLPPPPVTVLKGTATEGTAYRSVSKPPGPPPRRAPAEEVNRPPPASAEPRSSEPRSAPESGRYAPSRPASIFGNARPQEGSSIFGEDLISEKSLDEVILSYLAEDLESGAKK